MTKSNDTAPEHPLRALEGTFPNGVFVPHPDLADTDTGLPEWTRERSKSPTCDDWDDYSTAVDSENDEFYTPAGSINGDGENDEFHVLGQFINDDEADVDPANDMPVLAALYAFRRAVGYALVRVLAQGMDIIWDNYGYP